MEGAVKGRQVMIEHFMLKSGNMVVKKEKRNCFVLQTLMYIRDMNVKSRKEILYMHGGNKRCMLCVKCGWEK